MSDSFEITQLLVSAQGGDRAAADLVVRLLYDQLHRMAEQRLRGQPPDCSTPPTELVHEVYLKTFGDGDPTTSWSSRAHFLGVSARVMRNLLVDRARARATSKRGGGARPRSLDEILDVVTAPPRGVIALDDALEEMASIDAQSVELVQLRYFAGLTWVEVAEVLGVTLREVSRKWKWARRWLRTRLRSW